MKLEGKCRSCKMRGYLQDATIGKAPMTCAKCKWYPHLRDNYKYDETEADD